MRRSVLLSLALVGIGALAVPAAASAANPVVEAAKRSAKAHTTTLRFSSQTTATGLGRFTTSGTGAQSGTSAKLRMRATGAGSVVTMDAIARAEHGGFVMYMRSPLFRSQLPKGKTWVRFDLQKAGASLGIDFSALTGASDALAPLWHGVVSTRSLGAEVVAGKPSTHYRVVVDYRRAAAKLPKFAEQLAALERVAGVRLGRVPADVWVGADGRIRRFRTVTPTRVQGVKGTSVQTITYIAYDVPVSVSAPPERVVFEPPS
jgi:hypothetical protein